MPSSSEGSNCPKQSAKQSLTIPNLWNFLATQPPPDELVYNRSLPEPNKIP